MSLSNELISQFIKATNDDTGSRKKETTVYGTTVEENGSMYVKIDGSDQLTPVSTTAGLKNGERVTVMIKNHSAIVTGNITSPSANRSDLDELNYDFNEFGNRISEFEIIVADKVSSEYFNSEVARIDDLVADNVVIKKTLVAAEADIEELQVENVTITEKLTADEAEIAKIKTDKLDAVVAEATYATIEELDSTNARVYNLESTYGDFSNLHADKFEAIDADISELRTNSLTAADIEGKYANIDFSNIGKAAIEYFYATSGLIEDVTVDNGTITGKLVGVTISGDLIEGNTVKAEKLVIKGTDGLYYKLNTDGMKTEAQQTDQNSINGSVIKAKSITATKISVSDLVAFGATIGGFHIADHSIYSGAKSSVANTTRGIYMDDGGQIAFGDSNNFVKFFKDTDGTYKLAISANSILFGSSNKSVEAAISDVQTSVDNITIGGRNLLRHSKLDYASDEWHSGGVSVSFENGYLELTKDVTTSRGYYNQNGVPIPQTNYEYTLSIEVMKMPEVDIPSDSSAFVRYILDGTVIAELIIRIPTDLTEGIWTKLSNSFIYDDEVPTSAQVTIALGKAAGGLAFRNIKYETGNKPTDWTPAPEDMATAVDVEIVTATANDAQTRVSAAEASIEMLSESISMLVTDGNGTSLMTQTDEGWTFSTAEIQAAVNRTSESLNDLTDEVGDVNNTVGILQQAVADLGEIAEYVKIGTYEDEPCIELGEGDSDFKLRITNTRMMFVEGSNTLAYFNNQSLYIKKAVVEEELQQGGFVWKVRSNGNMGLVWKGGGS